MKMQVLNILQHQFPIPNVHLYKYLRYFLKNTLISNLYLILKNKALFPLKNYIHFIVRCLVTIISITSFINSNLLHFLFFSHWKSIDLIITILNNLNRLLLFVAFIQNNIIIYDRFDKEFDQFLSSCSTTYFWELLPRNCFLIPLERAGGVQTRSSRSTPFASLSLSVSRLLLHLLLLQVPQLLMSAAVSKHLHLLVDMSTLPWFALICCKC